MRATLCVCVLCTSQGLLLICRLPLLVVSRLASRLRPASERYRETTGQGRECRGEYSGPSFQAMAGLTAWPSESEARAERGAETGHHSGAIPPQDVAADAAGSAGDGAAIGGEKRAGVTSVPAAKSCSIWTGTVRRKPGLQNQRPPACFTDFQQGFGFQSPWSACFTATRRAERIVGLGRKDPPEERARLRCTWHVRRARWVDTWLGLSTSAGAHRAMPGLDPSRQRQSPPTFPDPGPLRNYLDSGSLLHGSATSRFRRGAQGRRRCLRHRAGARNREVGAPRSRGQPLVTMLRSWRARARRARLHVQDVDAFTSLIVHGRGVSYHIRLCRVT